MMPQGKPPCSAVVVQHKVVRHKLTISFDFVGRKRVIENDVDSTNSSQRRRMTTSESSSSSMPSSYIMSLFTDDVEWIQNAPSDRSMDHDLDQRLLSAYEHLSVSWENENIRKTLEVLLQYGLVVEHATEASLYPTHTPSISIAHYIKPRTLLCLSFVGTNRLRHPLIYRLASSTRTRLKITCEVSLYLDCHCPVQDIRRNVFARVWIEVASSLRVPSNLFRETCWWRSVTHLDESSLDNPPSQSLFSVSRSAS